MSQYQSQVFKVLHQSHSVAQFHPKAEQDILWPCLRFAISLQARAEQPLNLFEGTLLRLLAEGVNDLEQLNQQMGLTSEDKKHSSLAEFLCLKLQQLNLVSERLQLTDEGKQVLNQLSETKTQVISASVYFDLINKCWLPVISRGELQPIHAERSKEGSVDFSQGSVGRTKRIKALPLVSEVSTAKAPSERDVIDIIRRSRQINKKLKAFSADAGDGFVTKNGTISVNPEGELVCLHCYAFSVAGAQTFYVSDGFRSTIQERFTRGFNNPHKYESNQSIKAARKKLWNKSRRGHQRDTLRPSKSYEELYESLTDSKDNKVSNATDQSVYENNLKRFLSQSYAEIERILAECYAFSKRSSCVAALSSDPKSNAELAIEVSSQLGFQVEGDKLVNKLLMTNKGSVIHLKADKPVMSPLLLCHLMAARDDMQQPMAKLAQEYPLLLRDIARLRRWRNPIDHGDAAAVLTEVGSKEIDFVYELVEKVRLILAEWLEVTEGRVSKRSTPSWLEEGSRFEARHQLEKDFGLMVSRMNDHVYQGLLDALVEANSEDARRRVNALAGALQHALYQACRALDVNEAESIDDAKDQLAGLGCNQIAKSNKHKVELALKGGDATLGANFIAFWAQITDQQRHEAQRFVKSADSLVKIRGHSGSILDQRDHDRVNKIEKDLFGLIKYLMEQYCG
jgi:hypothetical protein